MNELYSFVLKNLPQMLISGIIIPPFLVAVASVFGKHQPLRLTRFTFIASCISFFCSLFLLLIFHNPFQFTFILFNFSIDALSIYFILLVNIVALFASYFTKFVKAHDEAQKGNESKRSSLQNFHMQFNFFHWSMLLVPMIDNLLYLWVLIAFTTVISAPLIGYRGDRKAREAAWKYIMISSSGIVFALLGTIFLVSAFKDSRIITLNWSELICGLNRGPLSVCGPNSPLLTVSPNARFVVKLSFSLILLGYGTKAGLFPMHTWLPDGHGEAPSPVSALLSGVLLKSALYVILRFYVITNLALQTANGGFDPFASNMLLIFGSLSLFMAMPFILNTKKENRFKRVLAYHSLEHMGIITFGFGLGGGIAFIGALLQVLNHALAKALMFLAYGNVQSVYQREQIPDEGIHGVFRVMPVTGCLLVLGGLALVGAPPFSIFLSEFIILSAAFQNSLAVCQKGIPGSASFWMILAICLFLISVAFIFVGLVNHLGRIVLGTSPIKPEGGSEQWWQNVVLGILLLLLIYGGLTTFPLTHILQQSVSILSQGVQGGRCK